MQNSYLLLDLNLQKKTLMYLNNHLCNTLGKPESSQRHILSKFQCKLMILLKYVKSLCQFKSQCQNIKISFPVIKSNFEN